MNKDCSHYVLTYGLTEYENELLKEQHTEYKFDEVTYSFTALSSYPAAAVILDPEALTLDEVQSLDEICWDEPLFIFTKHVTKTDLPVGIIFELSDVSDTRFIANKLDFAKRWWICTQEKRYDSNYDDACIEKMSGTIAAIVELFGFTEYTVEHDEQHIHIINGKKR